MILDKVIYFSFNSKDKEKKTDETSDTPSVEENTATRRQTSENKKEKTTEDESEAEKKKDKGCEPDEVLAVLCHEFGHWSLSHNLINMIISFVC